MQSTTIHHSIHVLQVAQALLPVEGVGVIIRQKVLHDLYHAWNQVFDVSGFVTCKFRKHLELLFCGAEVGQAGLLDLAVYCCLISL